MNFKIWRVGTGAEERGKSRRARIHRQDLKGGDGVQQPGRRRTHGGAAAGCNSCVRGGVRGGSGDEGHRRAMTSAQRPPSGRRRRDVRPKRVAAPPDVLRRPRLLFLPSCCSSKSITTLIVHLNLCSMHKRKERSVLYFHPHPLPLPHLLFFFGGFHGKVHN